MYAFTKGVVVMAGFIGQALPSLFKENEDVIRNARELASRAACRIHRVESATNLMDGSTVVRWQIEFQSEEDASAFDSALRNLVQIVTEEE